MPIAMPDDALRASLLFSAAVLEYSLASTFALGANSGDGDPAYSHQASAATLFAPDAIQLAVGAYLSVSSGYDGTDGDYRLVYDGPCAPFGGYVVAGEGFRSTVRISARFLNFRLYEEDTSLMRVMFDGVEIREGDTLKVTLGPPVDAESAGLGPCYVPIVGIPPTVSGSCSAGRANVSQKGYDPCDPSEYARARDYQTAGGSLVSGGYRYRETENGPWTDLPVLPYTGETPSAGQCPFGLSASGVVSAPRSYGSLIACESQTAFGLSYLGRTDLPVKVTQVCTPGGGTDDGPVGGSPIRTEIGTFPAYCQDPCTGQFGPAYGDLYKTENANRNAGGTVTLVPEITPELERLAPGYVKLVRRLWFPETRARLSHACTDLEDGVGPSNSVTVEPVVHPGLGNDFLGEVRDGDAPVLDGLDHPAFAPVQASRTQSSGRSHEWHSPTLCACPPPGIQAPGCPPGYLVGYECEYVGVPEWTDLYKAESASLQFPSYVGPSGDYQGHAEPLARYFATWCNPFWHYFSHAQAWRLQGDEVAYADYWGPVRTQMIRNAALPGLPSTRSHMIGDPYYDSGLTPFWEQFTGGMTALGTSRWKTYETPFPEMAPLDARSAPMFSCPDGSCEISVDTGGLKLAATGDGPCVVDVDLVRFDCFPFGGLLLAKTVRFPGLANVAELKASLRSSLGGAVDLNDGNALAAGAEYPFPRGKDGGYAGTWGIDDGAGYLPDQGTDVAPGGQSAAKMGDPETAAGFQGVRAVQGQTLRLSIVPNDPESAATIDLPSFRRFQGHPEVRWLSGSVAALFWADGPMVRFGSQDWYVHDEGLYVPPLTKGMGEPNSAVDLVCFLRWVFAMEDPGDVAALNALFNGLYDAFEVPNRNLGNADKFSFSFLLPKKPDGKIRGALVQTIGEVPPMPLWYARKRDDAWNATGAPAHERFDQAQEKNYVVSPVSRLVLQKPDGTPVSSPGPSVAGWAVDEYVLPLGGDEADDFRLVQGETLVARVYPWRGWTWVGDFAKQAKARALGLDVSRPGRWSRGYAQEGGLRVGFAANFALPGGWSERDLGVPADWVRVRYARVGQADPLYLLAGADGALTLYRLDSEGGPLAMSQSIGPGQAGELLALADGPLLVWRVDGGTVRLRRFRRDEAAIGDEVATNLSGLDDETAIAAGFYPDPRTGKRRIGLLHTVGETLTLRLSDDGVTFDA